MARNQAAAVFGDETEGRACEKARTTKAEYAQTLSFNIGKRHNSLAGSARRALDSANFAIRAAAQIG